MELNTSILDDSTEELLKTAYQSELRDSSVPKFQSLYESFCNEWFLHIYNYLETNADAFELSEDDMLDTENLLDLVGFSYPSCESLKWLLDANVMTYEHEDNIFNKVVQEIW